MKEENIVNTEDKRLQELESVKISSCQTKVMKESEVEAVASSLSMMRIKREPTEDDEESTDNNSKRSSSSSERGDNSRRSSSNSDKEDNSKRSSSNSDSSEICSPSPIVEFEKLKLDDESDIKLLTRGPKGGAPVQDNPYAHKAYNGLANPDYIVQKVPGKRQVEEAEDTDPYFKFRRPVEDNHSLQDGTNFGLNNPAMHKFSDHGSTYNAQPRDMMGGGKLVVKSSSLDLSQSDFSGADDMVDSLINGGHLTYQMPNLPMSNGVDQQAYTTQNLQPNYFGQQFFPSQNLNSMNNVNPRSYPTQNSPSNYSVSREGMIQTNMQIGNQHMAYPCMPNTTESSNMLNLSKGMVEHHGYGIANSSTNFTQMQHKSREPVESETDAEKSPFSDQMYSPESSKSINSPPPSNMSGDSGIVGDAVGSPMSNMSPQHEGGQYTWDDGNRSPATKSVQSPQMMNVPSPQQPVTVPSPQQINSPQQQQPLRSVPSPQQKIVNPSSQQRLGPSSHDGYQDNYVEQNLDTLHTVLEVIGEDLLEQNQRKKNENPVNYNPTSYSKLPQAPLHTPPQGQQNVQYVGQGHLPRQNGPLIDQSQFQMPPKQLILPAHNIPGQGSNQNTKQPQVMQNNIPMTMLSKPPNQNIPIQSVNTQVPTSFVGGSITVQNPQMNSQPVVIMTQPTTMVTTVPPINISTQPTNKSVPLLMVPPQPIAPQPVVTGQGQPNTIIIVQTNQQPPMPPPKKQREIRPKVPQSNTDTPNKSITNAVSKPTPSAPRAGQTGNINEKRQGMSPNKPIGNQTTSPQAQQRQYQLNLARRTVADISREHLMYEDDEGDTYLHVAVCRTDSSMVQALLERLRREQLEYRIDVQNKQTQTPLYLAVAANQPQMVNMFLKCKANPNTMAQVKSADGSIEVKAPIHVASSNGEEYLTTLQELLKMSNVDLNMRNSEGCSALHCAILAHRRQNQKGQYINSIRVIEMLIKKGAEPNSQDLKSGKTPLMYAIEKRDPNLVEKLLCLFDTTKLKNIVKNSQTFDGSSCLKIAEGLKTDFQQESWQRLWNMLNSAINGDPPRIQYCK